MLALAQLSPVLPNGGWGRLKADAPEMGSIGSGEGWAVGDMGTGTPIAPSRCVLGAACRPGAVSMCLGELGSLQSWPGVGLMGPSPMDPL